QIKTLSPEAGQPLAAINGDFYEKSKDFPVRPRDVQIRQGELVTGPFGHSSFWLDANGKPQMTNILSRFKIFWPDGKATPFFLNVQRTNTDIVLYTAAAGKSTHTQGGVEYVLERAGDGDWLPLRAGKSYSAKVRAVQKIGDSPLR